MFSYFNDNFDSISRSSDARSNDGKYNPNRPRDVIRKISSDSYRAPSVISGHSKASEQSRGSNISRKSHQSNGSMQQMIKDSKKDLRDSIYDSCITGGPLGPARTKEEIRNRKTLLISIVTGLFLVILFLILKEVAYNKQKAEDDMEIEELEKDLKQPGAMPVGGMMGAVPMNPMMGMHPGQMYIPGMPHPGLQVPAALPVNPMFPNQMSIMHEQHKLLQQLAGKSQIPQHPTQNLPQNTHVNNPAVMPQAGIAHAGLPQAGLPQSGLPQAGVPQAAAQIAVQNPEEQFFIQNEGTQDEVDRFANMYTQIETLLASFVDTISSYTTDLKQSLGGSEEKALDLLNQEKNKMIKFLTKEEQHFQSKVAHEKNKPVKPEQALDFEMELGEKLGEQFKQMNEENVFRSKKAEHRNARKKALLEGA